jgi:plastocyanin
MKKLIPVLCACFALALVAAGCGSSDNKKSDSNTAPAKAAAPKAPAAPKSGVVAVSIKNVKFHPDTITVKAGSTVKWTNDDGFAHTVTKTGGPGAKFDSGNVNGGATYEQKFATPGTIDYVCTIHPGQSGKIVVQ